MVSVETDNHNCNLAIYRKSRMAQSLRLNDDKYWDTSALNGGAIFNDALVTISGSGSVSISVPNNFRGIVCMFRNANTMSAYLVNTLSGGSIRVCPILTTSELSLTSSANNRLTATSTGTVTVTICYIGNQKLSA